MKKIFTILVVVILTFTQTVTAQNLIAVQNGGEPEFYVKLDSAVVHAQDGDTIYIPEGAFGLSIWINKKIHLIGIGCNSDTISETGISIIDDLLLMFGADGGSVEGIYINGPCYIGYSDPIFIDGYCIRRCHIQSGIHFPNYNGTNSSTNISIIESNIGYNYDNGEPKSISGHTSGIISILNCKIAGTIHYFNYLLVQNSIFYSTYPGPIFIGEYGTVKNNIFYQSVLMEDCSLYTAYSNNIGIINNGVDGNSNFGVENQVEDWEDTFIDPDNGNYHLKTTSIGKNSGTDGTDRGIYGGAFPWKEGSIPFNPHFQAFDISPVTDSTGNLNVNIQVEAQDY